MKKTTEIRASVKTELFAEIRNFSRWLDSWHMPGSTGFCKDFTFSSAFADINEDGICTNIRCYSVGEAKEFRHHNLDSCIDISDVITAWAEDLIDLGAARTR